MMSAVPRLLVWALAATAGLATNPAQAGFWQYIPVSREPRTVTIKKDGVLVKATIPSAYGDDEADARIKVAIGGLKPFGLARDPMRSGSFGIGVGIGKLNPRDLHPTILISGFSGGAHCCETLQIVSLVNGEPVTIKLDPRDGDMMDKFPTDIDGDGIADIRWADSSLLYEFAAYASSWNVPRIIDIKAGHAIDVSRERSFAKIYRDFTAKTLRGCGDHSDVERNGSCAAYAYGMAILGKPEEGIRTASALAGDPGDWLPDDCLVAYDEQSNCPKGKEITFTSFEPALRYMMRKNGYLPALRRPSKARATS
jgi:hypothetical protein